MANGSIVLGSTVSQSMRGAVTKWFVHWTPDLAVSVLVLAGVIVLCSRHLTLTVPLSTQEYTVDGHQQQNAGGKPPRRRRNTPSHFFSLYSVTQCLISPPTSINFVFLERGTVVEHNKMLTKMSFF